MTGERKAIGESRGEIVPLLLRDGVLSEEQLRHVERVRAKLGAPRPLVPLLLELGLLEAEALRSTLGSHRLGLRIGALLVELGHVREYDLRAALALQAESPEPERKLGEILVEQGVIGAQQLAEVLASQLGVPCVPPGGLDPDPSLIVRVPLELCRRHRFLPLRVESGRVAVAFADPLEKGDAAAAQQIFGAELSPWIATPAALDEALTRLELSERVVSDVATGESTAAQTLREILHGAVRACASEVHLEPGAQRVVVRLRRDGVLTPWRELPISLAAPLVRCLEREAGVEGVEGALHRDGSIRLEHGGRIFEVRASFFATANGESVVLRIRDPQRAPLPLDALGLLPSMRRRLEDDALTAPGGLFLICGPSGSGRTTTLHACATACVGPGARVVLLEEMLEARLIGLSQSVLPHAVAPRLAECVEVALRQDPDVLALGALREPDDLAIAVRAARAGPRVLGLLEAEDAVAALLLTVAAAGVQGHAPSALVGALAQRLVRRVCESCAEPVVPSAAELRRLGCTPLELAGGSFRRGRGCGRCRETGFDGRIGLFELLLLDDAARDHLRGGEGAATLRRCASTAGPATLLEDGLVKAAQGLTTLGELLRVVPRVSRPRAVTEIERVLGGER